MTVTLVLGGARSGKTAFALQQAQRAGQARKEGEARASGDALIMIATAQAFDDEMRERIARHQEERDGRWRTVEAPMDLAAVIGGLGARDVAVVDCLTLWLTNVMLAERDVEAAVRDLVEAVAVCPAKLWLVSNEVGWGLVPETALGRRFRDEAGRLHQRLAQAADAAVLIVAGLPLTLK